MNSKALSRDRVIFALRQAAVFRGKGLPHRIVSRAAKLLDVSPTTIRKWIRKDPKVAAAKNEADKVWMSEIEAKLEEVKKLMSSRERELLEAAKQKEVWGDCKINFDLIKQMNAEFNKKWTNPLTRNDVYGLPAGVKELYEYNDHRDEYRLTSGGMLLSKVRCALRDGPVGKIQINAEVGLNDWTLTVGVATVPERKELLKLAAGGAVKVRR